MLRRKIRYRVLFMSRIKVTPVTLYLMLQRKIGYNIKVVVTSEVKIR